MGAYKSSKFWSLAAFLIVVVTTVITWNYAKTHDFIVCDMECGETLLSIKAIDQFVQFGPRFGFLEVLGTEEQPLIYTHSVNIGSLSFVGLRAMGLEGMEYYIFLPLIAYAIGLYFAYLTALKVTDSHLSGFITLILFCTTYWGLGAFSMNALRAWHLPAFFIVAYFSLNLSGELNQRRFSANVLGLVLGALIAFGCGYDFWVICGFLSASLIFKLTMNAREVVTRIHVVAVAFSIPFLLRQMHVASVLGLDFWVQDFLYSLAIKIPYASTIIDLPPLSEVDQWYLDQGVLRAPASATNSLSQILYTFSHMLTEVTIPRWGWVSIMLVMSVLVCAVIPKFNQTRMSHAAKLFFVPGIVGVSIGVFVFSPFSLHVYFKHEFPLFAFFVVFAKGLILSELLISLKKVSSARWRAGILAGASFILLDSVMNHLHTTANGQYNNFGWTNFVQQHPSERFLAASYNVMISRELPMTDGFSVDYINPDSVSNILSDPEQLKGYDFLIYQPIERLVDFDARVPRCTWRDWMTSQFVTVDVTPSGNSCIYGFPLPSEAAPQLSLTDIERSSYPIVERDDVGIGYVIVDLR